MKRLFCTPAMIVITVLALLPAAATANSEITESFHYQAAVRAAATHSGPSFQTGLSGDALYGTPIPALPAYEAGGSKGKNPTTALVLSLLIPGVGQFYNGHVLKGLGFLSLQFVGATMYAVGQTEDTLKDIGNLLDAFDEGGTVQEDEGSGMKWAGLGIMAANSILSGWEAYSSAKRINGRANYRGFALYRNVHTGRSLGISMDPVRTVSGSPGGGLALKAAF